MNDEVTRGAELLRMAVAARGMSADRMIDAVGLALVDRREQLGDVEPERAAALLIVDQLALEFALLRALITQTGMTADQILDAVCGIGPRTPGISPP